MPPVLPRGREGKEERIWNGITILARMEGRKEGRKKEGGQGEYEGATSRRSPFFISTEPHLVFYSSALLGTPAVRDAPLSPRCRSRHLLLALFFPATRHLHNYNLASPVSKTRAPGPEPPSASVPGPVVVVVFKREGKKKRMERKGRIAKLAPVNHDTYRGKKQSWPRIDSSRLYICIRSLLFKRGTFRSNRFSRIESTSRNELFHGYKKKRDLLFFLFLLTFANHRVWSRRNSLSIYERSTKVTARERIRSLCWKKEEREIAAEIEGGRRRRYKWGISGC